MSVVYHSKEEYWPIKKKLTERDDVSFGHFVRVTMILARFGGELLTPMEMMVVFFILGRTLSYSKQGEVISKNNFLKGMKGSKGRVCSGVGLCKNTLEKVLKDLIEKDLVVAHAFKNGKSESDSRIYTINLEKMFVYPLFGNEEELAKIGLIPTPSGGVPLPHAMGDQREHILREETSTNVDVSVASAPTYRRVVRMGKRIEVDCNADPRELVKSITARATANQSTRVAKSANGVPKNKWSSQDLQALLDKARATATEEGFTVPRVMVVAKSIGVLHKRMLDKEIADPLKVLTWALKHWGTVASANRRAKARQTKETKAVQSEMSMAPNFNDLAYRFPYIMAMYENRDQQVQEEKLAVTHNLERRQSAKQINDTIADAKRELAKAVDLRAEEARKAREADTVQRVRRTRSQPVVADDNFEFPLHRSERS